MPIAERIIAWISRRPIDFIIGEGDRPYMHRWWVIPRNRFFNIYIHRILRDDDDRALHTHPWVSLSIPLRGSYLEVTKRRRSRLGVGQFRLRLPSAAHRLEVGDGECWSLFVTGPKVREWGFLCPQGFVHWRDFVNTENTGEVGPGCGR